MKLNIVCVQEKVNIRPHILEFSCSGVDMVIGAAVLSVCLSVFSPLTVWMSTMNVMLDDD